MTIAGMKYFISSIPVSVLVFLFSAGAQTQVVRVPMNVMKQLELQCTICMHQPHDSSSFITAQTLNAHFHNSLIALKKGYADEAYQHTLHTLTALDTSKQTNYRQYTRYIKAKILYYKHVFNEALKEYTDLLHNDAKDSIIINNIYANIAEIHLEQENFTEALAYFETWKQLFMHTADYTSTQSYYRNKAQCLLLLEKYTEAEQNLLTCIESAEQHHDTLGLANVHTSLANLYYAQYLDNKAIIHFTKALQFAKRAGDIKTLRDVYFNMAVVEENRKQFAAALEYRKQYESMTDSLTNRDKVWLVAEQERKSALQLNENKIKLLHREAELRSIQMRGLLFAALGILLVAALIFYAYREKARSKKIIDRLFTIVAHDLRSPVYSLKTNLAGMRSALATGQFHQAETAAGNMQQNVTSTYNLLDNMLHWALSQSKQLFFRKERLPVEIIVKQVSHDMVVFAAMKNIEIIHDTPSAMIVIADRNSLKIILRNLLDNAIKYTPANGTITISAKQEHQRCRIQIKDTGTGMDAVTLQSLFDNNAKKIKEDAQGNRSTGFGLSLCKLMVEKNNGSIIVTSEKGKGTEVSIWLRCER